MKEKLAKIRDLIQEHPDPTSGMQAVVTCLFSTFLRYSWVGIYLVKDRRLVLELWAGPQATKHSEIDIGTGICGLAARTKETVVVDEVDDHEEYLACFPETRSEIVVPLMRGDSCVGEIDIDSEIPSAFGLDDQAFLEEVARMLVETYLSN